ncbi:hypothetical protein [Kitasatospora sp. McL0602]|uniref:hypothetical protein n=1 Tax=Kitasatospora sp. McL0602 TaxID=3439530 RepID=UPI003F895E15
MAETPETPTPADVKPGGVENPANPPKPEVPETPKPSEPDYKALYEKSQGDLAELGERVTAANGEKDEAGIEADELRAQVTHLQEKALRDRIAAEYNLPPVLAKLVQGGDEAAVRAHAEELAAVADPKPVLGSGGLTPAAPKKFDPDEVARRALAPLAW